MPNLRAVAVLADLAMLGEYRLDTSGWLFGDTSLRVDHLCAICEVIGVPPRELLGTGRRIDPATDQVLSELLRTYAHPREALGDFQESDLLAAAEERLPWAKGKKREYLQDVIRWCESSQQLEERTALRRAGVEQPDPKLSFPSFKKYRKTTKKARRK